LQNQTFIYCGKTVSPAARSMISKVIDELFHIRLNDFHSVETSTSQIWPETSSGMGRG
jgi:hypothetical protein